MAPSTSAVSPLCDTATTSVFGLATLSRYRYSLAISTLTREQYDRVDRIQHAPSVVAEEFRHDRRHVLQGVRDRAWLLENLLLHVVTIQAEVGRAVVRGDRANGTFDASPGSVHDPVAMKLDVHDVAVFEVRDLVRHPRQRNRIGREEVLAFTDTDHERHAIARTHQPMRLVTANHRNGVAAAQPCDCFTYRVEQIAVVQIVDQMRDDFAIGLARKYIAVLLKRRAQFLIVLDDPVVRERDSR
jgi:hypothetical protein